MTCGWLTGSLGNFLEGEQGKLRVPVPAYLIDHPQGKVLFDTGLHVATQSDPEGRLGALARVFSVEFSPGQDLAAQLAAMEVGVGEIRFVVNSHLHFDHAGGNAQVPNATLVVQRREWQAGGELVLAADACYLRRTLEELHLPPIRHDREAMLDSLRKLRRLRDAGARIFYGHDPEFWSGVPQAPAEVR